MAPVDTERHTPTDSMAGFTSLQAARSNGAFAFANPSLLQYLRALSAGCSYPRPVSFGLYIRTVVCSSTVPSGSQGRPQDFG